MPKLNYTIDNVTPTIVYTPRDKWMEGNASLDARMHEYYGQTYTTTVTANSTAAFSFNGTGIWVYGAKNPNHGNYSVTLDGNRVGDFAGAGDDQIQSVLYSATSLSKGMHTVALSYTPIQEGYFFDIDFITYEVDIGEPNEALQPATIQDNDPKFRYVPVEAWTSILSDTSDKFKGFNGTGHITSQDSATATLEFIGDAITIWGNIGPNNSPYSVSLDGGAPVKLNGTNVNYYAQVMLFEANDLGPCKHTVLLKNEPERLGQYLSVDYAVITNTASTKSSGPICQRQRRGLSGGAAVGIAIGGTAVVLVIFLSMWVIVWRRRKSRPDVFKPVTTPRPFAGSTASLVSPSHAATAFLISPTSRSSYNPRIRPSTAPATVGGKRHMSYNPSSPRQARVELVGRSPSSERLRESEKETDAGPLSPSYIQATHL